MIRADKILKWSVAVDRQAEFVVTFYTKAGCHLCDHAREALEEIADGREYDLTEIDIRSDMTVFEMYRYRIPVIIINQQIVVEGQIDTQILLRAFEEAGEIKRA